MILVFVETDAHGATETSQETLTVARDLASRRGDDPVHAVVVGPDPDLAAVADQLGALGVETVHHAEGNQVAEYAAAAWAATVVDVARSLSADVVAAAGSPRGSEIMAHVATRMDAVMAANVVAIDTVTVDRGEPLVVTRQVMGGSAFEEMRVASSPAVLTVAGHATEIRTIDAPSPPSVHAFEPTVSGTDLRARVVRTEQVERDDSAALAGARVVVGGGRGVGSADGFSDLLELTQLLGGALGVTRVVTSLGWRPHHEQVGQTGSRIAPDVYIACGISGAIQHWAGCQSAKTIIAINADPDAPMVTKAHYAVIGDLHEIVPAINDELRRRRTGAENSTSIT